MMKISFAAISAIAISLLVACNQLTQYSINEREINKVLQRHNNFAKNINLSGIADVHVVLTNLSSAIGREEMNKVTLTSQANLDMNSLFGSQKATIELKLQALPVLNKEEGAIFLQELEIINAKVQPEKMQSMLETVLPYLNQSLRNYFNKQPAYILREDASKSEALAKKFAKSIKVKPGEIVISLND